VLDLSFPLFRKSAVCLKVVDSHTLDSLFQLNHGLHCFFNGSDCIKSMDIEQIDTISLEALERDVAAFKAPLWRTVKLNGHITLRVDHGLVRELGRKEDIVPALGMPSEPLSDKFLAVLVRGCRVPEYLAELPGAVEDFESFLVGAVVSVNRGIDRLEMKHVLDTTRVR
jgi:hypothetical protein